MADDEAEGSPESAQALKAKAMRNSTRLVLLSEVYYVSTLRVCRAHA